MAKKGSMISDRVNLLPCPIGMKGFCCKICLMGPCRLVDGKQKGVCGASQDLVVSRNILRFAAGGASAHCGHSYHLLKFMGKRFPGDYVRAKAPRYLYNLWDDLGIIPKISFEHFKDISEALHLSTMGVNADYEDVLKWCMKIGIVDGYYGMYLATELEDKRFGKPKIRKGKLNLDCLDPNKVNIAIHGHEPIIAEALVGEAKKHKNVNLVGVCCTGATLLAKHGVPLAANFLLQEDVVATGIIDALVVDVQCVMPSLSDLCECYHTKLITTNEIGVMPHAIHMPAKNAFEAKKVAERIISIAEKNKKNRRKEAETLFKIQKIKPKTVVVGFTEYNINTRKIADMIKDKKVKGIIGVVGCVNPRTNLTAWVKVFKKLSNDYIILASGCMAFELGKHNMLDGKKVFHMGSCVNNSRIAEVLKRVSEHLKKEITQLPFLISCPAPITEKAVAIGFFFASIGVDVHFGYPFLLSSDANVAYFLANVLEKKFKSKVFLDTEPQSFYDKINKGLIVSPQ